MFKRSQLRGALFIFLTSLSACSLKKKSLEPGLSSRPLWIAHRAGTADSPENTLLAIKRALTYDVDGLWLTVQLSSDGVPVLYRPKDLSALTNSTGPVSQKTAQELAQVNAGWHFRTQDGEYPYRINAVGIPTLEEALQIIPPATLIILDMKALPAPPQTEAVARVLSAHKAWSRVRIYSTEAEYQKTFAFYPQAKIFESRDATRYRLFETALTGQCTAPRPETWAGFEMKRDINVVERFTLGEGRSTFHTFPWTVSSLRCFRSAPKVKVVAFGVNTVSDYRKALCLGMDAVLIDSPATLLRDKVALSIPLTCTPSYENRFRGLPQ